MPRGLHYTKMPLFKQTFAEMLSGHLAAVVFFFQYIDVFHFVVAN